MVLTPEDLERLLREQVRQAALIKQQVEHPPRWHRRIGSRLTALLRDRVLVGLWLVTAGGAVLAFILMLGALPFGGGSEKSSLAIGQGSSLIFVVILVGLMSGPVEAGKRVGLGTAFVASDGRTWLGLGWVASLSLGLLAIGWSKPDSREELATLAITASGLGATGLVARRLLRLSNPEAHLEDQYAKSLRDIHSVLSTSRKTSDEALKRLGIEGQVATTVGRYVDPSVQRRVAVHAQAFTTVATRAWQEGDWVLATRAHLFGIAIGHEYLALIEAFDSQDAVFTTLINETDDLHEVCGGPEGRKLSRALLSGLRNLGAAVASKDGVVDADGHNPGVFGFVHELDTMLRRRAGDQKSEDPAAALRAMGDIGIACVPRGAVWSTATALEKILEWAAAASNTNVIHIGMTAWEESVRILVSLAKDDSVNAHPYAFSAALDYIISALRKLETLPKWSLPSTVGPILRSSTDGVHPTLQAAFYALWATSADVLEEVAEFGRGVVWQFSRLLGTVQDARQAHIASKDVGEVFYQWICAAATRGSELEPSEEAHRVVVDSVANTLGWLRGLLVSDGAVRENHDLDELLHIYASGWQILVYLVRDMDALPEHVKDELTKLEAELTSITDAELPATLRDGLEHLTTWLSRVGAEDESRDVAKIAAAVPMPTYGPWGPHGGTGWGMGGRAYFTRRGGLIPAVVSRIEEFFGEPGGGDA